jgi:hypothetical protein
MASVKVPSKVSSITVAGSTLTPVANRVTPASDTNATTLLHPTTRPKFKSSAANGDITINFPSIVTSITIDGVVYTPNGSGDITVPAAVGTAYLQELKHTFFN